MKTSILALLMCFQITPIKVYNELVKQGVKCPEIVLRQSILETGWYGCTGCSLDVNNLFGLTYYDKQAQKRRYQSFENWTESVAKYKKWQDKYYKGGDYYDFLECVYKNKKGECKRYATSPTYISKLKNIKVDV